MSTVGAVIEGGKDSTTGVIDSSVKGVATVSTAVLIDVIRHYGNSGESP